MLGAVDALQKDIPGLTTIDARGSRQIPEATRVLKRLRASGGLGKMVVMHIGHNGAVTDEEFDDVMKFLSNTRKVLVVNTTVPDGYQYAPNNQVLADGVVWRILVTVGHGRLARQECRAPRVLLHLTPRGARAYEGLIVASFRAQKE